VCIAWSSAAAHLWPSLSATGLSAPHLSRERVADCQSLPGCLPQRFRYHQQEHITACPCARQQRRAVCRAGFFTATCSNPAAATRVERVCWCQIVPLSSPCLLHLGVGDRRRAHVLAQPAHQLVRPQLAARDAQHRARRPVVPAQLRVLHLVEPVQYSLFAQPPANAHHNAAQ